MMKLDKASIKRFPVVESFDEKMNKRIGLRKGKGGALALGMRDESMHRTLWCD